MESKATQPYVGSLPDDEQFPASTYCTEVFRKATRRSLSACASEPASVCRATDLPWLHAAVAPVAAPGGATLLVSVALREKLDAARPAHVRGT